MPEFTCRTKDSTPIRISCPDDSVVVTITCPAHPDRAQSEIEVLPHTWGDGWMFGTEPKQYETLEQAVKMAATLVWEIYNAKRDRLAQDAQDLGQDCYSADRPDNRVRRTEIDLLFRRPMRRERA